MRAKILLATVLAALTSSAMAQDFFGIPLFSTAANAGGRCRAARPLPGSGLSAARAAPRRTSRRGLRKDSCFHRIKPACAPRLAIAGSPLLMWPMLAASPWEPSGNGS